MHDWNIYKRDENNYKKKEEIFLISKTWDINIGDRKII